MINCLKGSIHVLMSVLLCKIHCPLICFSNPFSHKYAASTLKLEKNPHTSLKTLVSATSDDDDDDHVDGHEVREEQEDGMVDGDAKEEASQIGGDDTSTLKSSLRKDENREKKKVQWVDMIGKELAEIREFEHSEEDEYDSDRGKTCVCVIL